MARLQAQLDEERALEVTAGTGAVVGDHAVAQQGRHDQRVDLASDEVVARVVALQEAVQGANLDCVAVAEAADFVTESQANADLVRYERPPAVDEPSEIRVAEAIHYVTSGQTSSHDVTMNHDDVTIKSLSGNHSVPEQITVNHHLAVHELSATGEKHDNYSIPPNLSQSPPGITANVATTWDIQFNKLKAYKLQHGNCKVPKLYPPDPQLGRWVNTQRYKNNTRSLNVAKKAQLQSIDFEWNLRQPNRSWKKWHKELLAYKSQHGHVNVPQRCKTNKALGAFVSNLRSEYRKYSKGQNSFLNLKRIRILEDLGFHWVARKGVSANGGDATDEAGVWQGRLTELKEYKERFRDCNVPKGWGENPSLGDWVDKQRQVCFIDIL